MKKGFEQVLTELTRDMEAKCEMKAMIDREINSFFRNTL